MKTSLILALLLAPCLLLAEDITFDPALASAATAYRAKNDQLRETRVTALIAAQDLYIAELKAASDKATREEDAATVATLATERKAVEDGILSGEAPAELPRKLVPARKNCIKACLNADQAHTKAAVRLNTEYLAALGRIKGTAPTANTTLLQQLEIEKKRVISGNFGPITDLHTQLANTSWKAVNNPGEVRTFSATKMNDTWSYTVVSDNIITFHWNGHSSATFVLAKDGRTLFKDGGPDMTLIINSEPK